MSIPTRLAALWTLALVLTVSFAQADVPQMINYQGRLTDSDSIPVDGPVLINFKIYGSESDNDSLWWSGYQTIQVDNGLFSYRLGSHNQIPADFFGPGSEPFLGIQIGTDPEITPRTPLTSSAFAWHSHTSDTATIAMDISCYHCVSTDDIDDGCINSDKIAPNAVNSSKIQNASIQFEDIGPNAAADGEIMKMIGGDWMAYPDNGLSLPFSSTFPGPGDAFSIFSTGSTAGDVFHIEAQGTSDRAAVFSITDSNNDETTLIVSTSGMGKAASFTNGNSLADNATVSIWTEGTAPGLEVINNNSGTKRAADFTGNVDVEGGLTISNVNGDALTIIENHTSSPDLVHIESQGLGRPLYISGNSNSDEVILAEQNGDGPGIVILNSSVDCDENSLRIDYSGIDDALEVHANGTGDAAYFSGDVDIVGNISKSGGSFKIDHPLNPETKYLQHSFVESPDMMNIYNGNVILDANGSATVTMPDYFEALNMEFRYQLTCIGGFAPVYVAEKISGNQFRIAGGEPGMEVSWQVTGIRNDKWAQANRVQIEVDKPEAEVGTYLHPEVHGQPIEKHVNYEQIKEGLDMAEGRGEFHED